MPADACLTIGGMAKVSSVVDICQFFSISYIAIKYTYIVNYRLKMLVHVRPRLSKPSQIFAICCLRFKRSVYSNKTVSVVGLLKLLSHFHTSDQRNSLV